MLNAVAAIVLVACTAGLVAAGITLRWPEHDPAAPTLGRRARVAAFWRSRLDPRVATGLAVGLAATVLIASLVVIGVLLLMIRTETGFAGYDLALARWAASGATDGSTTVLRTLTLLGGTLGVIVVATVAGLIEYRRLANRAIPALLACTVLGQFAVTNGIKLLVERARPDIAQLTGFAGASFPSGHAAAAAATFAAVALLVGRRRSRAARAALAGGAVTVAVAVAGTRVLLGVHWFTDVMAGLAVGWAWFALWSIAFGGRLLDFGAPADIGPGRRTR